MEVILELLKELGAKPEQVDAAKKELDEEVNGLRNKNSELLGKLKKAKDESGNSNHESVIAELEDKLSTALQESATFKKKYEIADARLTKVQTELNEQLVTEKSVMQKYLIDDGLSIGLSKLGITNATKIAAARALLKEKGIFQVKTDGEARKAIALLKKDGKDSEMELSDFLKEWSNSDEGKDFIPNNSSGGSAKGGTEGGGKSSSLQEAYDDAKKKGDVASMLAIKSKIAKEQE